MLGVEKAVKSNKKTVMRWSFLTFKDKYKLTCTKSYGVPWFQAWGFRYSVFPSDSIWNGPISSASPYAIDEHPGPAQAQAKRIGYIYLNGQYGQIYTHLLTAVITRSLYPLMDRHD